VKIAVDPKGSPWIVNSSHRIYHWNGSGWALYPGFARDISVGANGSVWVVGTGAATGGYGIFRWSGSAWVSNPGGATAIAVAANGHPWVVNASHQIFSS
jgi:hypothetical protein